MTFLRVLPRVRIAWLSVRKNSVCDVNSSHVGLLFNFVIKFGNKIIHFSNRFSFNITLQSVLFVFSNKKIDYLIAVHSASFPLLP